jgi:hypothetical protein
MDSVKLEGDVDGVALFMSNLNIADAAPILRESKMVNEKFPQRLLALVSDAVDVVIEFVGGGTARPLDSEYMPLLRDM